MPNLSKADRSQNITQTRQQEREQRILNAAAELILRWGYDKTTMDDISQKAGVAKGTLYLHWKTREELFAALLLRESLAMGVDFRRRILEDPAGATLRGIYQHAALVLIRRPLLKAVLLGDREIIGKLARAEENRSFYAQRLAVFTIYLEFLRQHSLIRTDISLQKQVYAISAIFTGFFTVEPLVLDELRPSEEEIAELIGETIQRTFESGREAAAGETQLNSVDFIAYLDEIQKKYETQA